jgi:hypothetical protein
VSLILRPHLDLPPLVAQAVVQQKGQQAVKISQMLSEDLRKDLAAGDPLNLQPGGGREDLQSAELQLTLVLGDRAQLWLKPNLARPLLVIDLCAFGIVALLTDRQDEEWL